MTRIASLLALATTLVCTAGGCAMRVDTHAPVEVQRAGSPLLYTDDRSRIEVITTNIGGKNVFIPSTVVLTEGSGRVLSFFNTTDVPHGMSIPALGIEVLLMPKEEYVLELPTLQAGRVLEMRCHIHPPHRGASLVVLPSLP